MDQHDLNHYGALAIILTLGIVFIKAWQKRERIYQEARSLKCQTDYFMIKQSITGAYANDDENIFKIAIENFRREFIDVQKMPEWADALDELLINPDKSFSTV